MLVPPYPHEFRAHTKGRWVGREIGEIFTKEFKLYSKEYYENAIESGKITVNGEKCDFHTTLDENDLIVHESTFTEMPVLDRPVDVVYEDEKFLVVNKPCSVPVHPCGAYKANSLIPLLNLTRPGAVDEDLKLTHRLDRLTSGLVVLAKTRSGAADIIQAFECSDVKKVYLARCLADDSKCVQKMFNDEAFPLPPGVTRIPIEDSESKDKDVLGSSKFKLEVSGWIWCVDHRSGINKFSVDAQPDDVRAKSSSTVITLLSRKGNECVVRCEPKTGRTHQIRLHLQHLHIPIKNDKCYGGKLEASEHCPLVRHLESVDKTADLINVVIRDEHEQAECKEELHPQGIFLHALEYAAPTAGLKNVVGPKPEWASLFEHNTLLRLNSFS